MNANRDPEGILGAWFDEGPTDLPDATRRAILTSLPTTPQARRGRLPRWGALPLRFPAQVAIGALVAVVAAGSLLYLLGRGPSIGTPTAAPSAVPSTTVSPTLGPSPRIAGAEVPARSQLLADGVRYVMPTFAPAFTFEGSASIRFGLDGERHAFLEWVSSRLTVLGAVRPECVFDETGAVEAVPADLVAWLEERTDITVISTTPVTLGAAEGTLIEATVHEDAFANRGAAINVFCPGVPCDFEEGGSIGYAPGDHVLLLVTIVDGEPVTAITAGPAASWVAQGPTLDAFLRSFAFPG